jgi:type V secretory pathway adhesin AidA
VATLGGRIYSSSSSPTMLNLGGPAVICQDGGLFSSDSFTATFSSAITDPAIEVRGGNVVMRNSSISGHAGIGLFAKGGGSIVECSGFSITGGSNGIRSEQGATVDASDSTIDSVTNNGVFALRGSKVVLEGASVTNSGSNDLAISEGGQIIISNGATTSGSPSASDTNVSAFNAIDGNKGIIWS